MSTYIEPIEIAPWANTFSLPALSPFTQAMIRSFDDKLVVYPSSEQPLYRVARREGCPSWVTLLAGPRPDYKVCSAYGLAPITSVFPANISEGDPWPRALAEISELDMFKAAERFGGDALDRCGSLYTDHQEAQEAKREARWRRDVQGEVHARSVDSYGLVKRWAGERVYMFDPVARTRSRASNVRLDFRPGGSSVRVPEIRQTAKAETGIVLTDA